MSLEQSQKFWTASDAWRRQRIAAQRKAARIRADLNFERKVERWRTDGGRYLRNYDGLGPDGWRWPTQALADEIAQRIEAMPSHVQTAYDEELAPIAFKAWRDTPVASGLLRASWNLEYSARGIGILVAEIANTSPYATFAVNTTDGRFSLRDVRSKVRAARDRIGARILELEGSRG